jgi:hypothetical protein
MTGMALCSVCVNIDERSTYLVFSYDSVPLLARERKSKLKNVQWQALLERLYRLHHQANLKNNDVNCTCFERASGEDQGLFFETEKCDSLSQRLLGWWWWWCSNIGFGNAHRLGILCIKNDIMVVGVVVVDIGNLYVVVVAVFDIDKPYGCIC